MCMPEKNAYIFFAGGYYTPEEYEDLDKNNP